MALWEKKKTKQKIEKIRNMSETDQALLWKSILWNQLSFSAADFFIPHMSYPDPMGKGKSSQDAIQLI